MALGNLADNAVKYTPVGTRIQLRARRDGQQPAHGVLLEVIDDGPGLPAAERKQLFKARFRGEGAANVPGTGTGLLLARQMIEVQGGTLELQWPVGGGTVAIIRLPQRDQPSSMDAPKA